MRVRVHEHGDEHDPGHGARGDGGRRDPAPLLGRRGGCLAPLTHGVGPSCGKGQRTGGDEEDDQERHRPRCALAACERKKTQRKDESDPWVDTIPCVARVQQDRCQHRDDATDHCREEDEPRSRAEWEDQLRDQGPRRRAGLTG